MSPDWPTLLRVHEEGAVFSLNSLSITCSYTSCFSSQSCLKPHTCLSASTRKQHGCFRNHTEWLKKQGTLRCLLEGSLQVPWVRNNLLFLFSPFKGTGPEEVIPMPSRSAIMVIALFTFFCQRQKALEVPSLPLAGLKFLHLASLEPLTRLPFHQSSHPTFPNTMVRQLKCLPDEEFSKERFMQVI